MPSHDSGTCACQWTATVSARSVPSWLPGYARAVDEGWRVSLALGGWAPKLAKLVAFRLDEDLRGRLGNGFRLTWDGPRVIVWSATPDVARAAWFAAQGVLAQLGIGADCRVERWDAVASDWLDPALGPADPSAAWACRQEEERAGSAEAGFAEWQVRVERLSHHELVLLAESLTSGGWSVIRRRNYLLAGADCEAEVSVLVPHIQALAGVGAVVSVQRRLRHWPPILGPVGGPVGIC
jgi:hypothetical protein